MREVTSVVTAHCREREGVNKPEAETACARQGSQLANIYDRLHYQKVITLIRSRTPIAHDYNHVWTGMSVNKQVCMMRNVLMAVSNHVAPEFNLI